MFTLAEDAATKISLKPLDDLSSKDIQFLNFKIPALQFIMAIILLVAIVFLVLFIIFLVKANKRKKVWKAYKKAQAQGKKLVAVPADRANEVAKAMKEGKSFASEQPAAAPAPMYQQPMYPAPMYAAPAPAATPNYSGPYVADKAYDQGAPVAAKADSSYVIKDGQYIAKNEAYYVSEFENHVAGIENVARDPEGYFVAENYKVGVLLRKDDKMYAQVYFYLKKNNQVLSAPITVRVDNEEAYSKAAFLFDVAARDIEAL